MFHRFFVWVDKWRGRLSRSEWTIALLRLPVSSRRPAPDHGLILVQIDGLSREELQKALDGGRMPFLKKLVTRERYRVHPMYSGVPSNTPAVQGELFYGIKTCAPAFCFVEKKTSKTSRMNDLASARRVEARMQGKGDALLEGGSSYSNVFGGGAGEESHFCSTSFGWGGLFKTAATPHLPVLVLMYLDIYIRMAALMLVETFLALMDFFRDTLHGRNIFSELQFIPTRVAVCILLREWVTAGVQIDAKRGLPVIHVNYLGYDEQAHHRGPSSAFAHWSLRGIDDAIFRVWKTAQRSRRRHYDLWIYSDHGQEAVTSYPRIHGCPVKEAVRGVLNDPQARVTSMGPIGHVYPAQRISEPEKERLALRLAREAGIPRVFIRKENGKVSAFGPDGPLELPGRAAEIFGSSHPYLEETTRDMLRVCRHPDAGVFVLSGWRSEGGPVSFQTESGAHGGPGIRETDAFMLLPRDAPLPESSVLRPLHLREAALRFLGRHFYNAAPPKRKDGGLRLMTYNVHSCIGMDGRLSPERIARVIAHHAPDVVALQELDVHCTRSGCVDQARRIAEKLEMKFHFHPSFHIEDGAFGNAVLSRYPMQVLRVGALPRMPSLKAEPRGAISVRIEVPGSFLHLVNTHLSIWPQERLLQARALGREWLDLADDTLVLCGDFNAVPGSAPYRLLRRSLHDVQKSGGRQKPRSTWSGVYPLVRIDHVFLGAGLHVLRSEVPVTSLERAASDHLPLVVDLAFPSGNPRGRVGDFPFESSGNAPIIRRPAFDLI